MENAGPGNNQAANNGNLVPVQTCKLPTPKFLEINETRESLTSWLDVLQNYLLRDANSQRFVSGVLRWNKNQANYGLVAEGPGSKLRRTAPEMEAALREMFRTISGFFPFSFLKRQLPNSTSFASIKQMVYVAYNKQLTAASLLEFHDIKKTPEENHFIFYSRIHDYFYEHLARPDATGGGFTAPAAGDVMTLSQANIIVLIWLEKTDKRLLKMVKQEYGAELRNNTELVELVPRIAADMDNLMMKLEDSKINRFGDFSGNRARGGDRRGRSDRSDKAGKFNKKDGAQGRDQLHCPHCKYLGQEMDMRVPFNHSPTDCRRKRVHVRRAQQEDAESDSEEYGTGEESSSAEGEIQNFQNSSSNLSSFQNEVTVNKKTAEPPPRTVLLSRLSSTEVPKASSSLHRASVSDPALRAIRAAAAKLISRILQTSPTRADSATVLCDYDGNLFVSVVDGGAELNCLDLGLVLQLKIPYVATDEKVTAAGEHQISLVGVTTSDVIFFVEFAGRSIPVNMQRAAVINNLGSSALIGEPAKRKNKLDVVSHQERVVIRYNNKVYHTGYHISSRRNYRLSRVSRSEVINPGECWSCKVPRGLSGEVFLVTARRDGPDWFSPGYYTAKEGLLEVKNTSGLPVSLTRKNAVFEVRTCTEDSIRDIKRRRKKLVTIIKGRDSAKKGKDSAQKGVTSGEKIITKGEVSGQEGKNSAQKGAVSIKKIATPKTKDGVEKDVVKKKTAVSSQEGIPGKESCGDSTEQPASEKTEKSDARENTTSETHEKHGNPVLSKISDIPSSGFRYENFRNPDVDPPVEEPEIIMDPDGVMSEEAKKKMRDITNEFAEVFTRRPGKYNGAFGRVDNSLNFSTTPAPNLKVYQPAYSDALKKELGDLMDRLIDYGVLQTPEDVGVTPEFISPSLIVPKAEEGEFRLVTDFSNLNKYIKKYPSTSPSFADTKSLLARKKYFVHLDLSNFFFQSGMDNKDVMYLCTYHPYRGVLCYVCSPQGLRNSSEQGYELLSRVFGQMSREDKLGRLMDSIIPVGDTWKELADNYRETLQLAKKSGLTFKPGKVTVCPQNFVLFGWLLSGSTWTPTAHTTSALSQCARPTTVKGLRSFLGSFKQFSDCVGDYGVVLHGLEVLVGGRGSAERIDWNEENSLLFENAKKAALDITGIHVPRPDDTLHTFSDYSQDSKAVGGRMEIHRKIEGEVVRLHGGYFSVVLDKYKQNWVPCEAEACGVRLVLEHFSPYIRESENVTIHHTDNLPTVQAWKRCQQGYFSSSSRISTFLSNLSELPVELVYKPGPQMHTADFFSRNPVKCEASEKCQVCLFAKDWQEKGDNSSAVRAVGVKDILEGRSIMPMIQTKTWLGQQIADGIHTEFKSLVDTGQQPEKRKTKGKYTILKKLYKSYQAGDLKIRRDGLVVVKVKNGHFDDHAISVPHHLMAGLAFTLHVKLSHPSKGQLQALMSRYFWCPGHCQIIQMVTDNCVQCRSMAQLPKEFQQDTTEVTESLGAQFAVDVMERNGQKLFVAREKLSQMTWITLIPDQTTNSLRSAIIKTILPWTHPTGATVRCDGATGFVSLSREKDTDTSVLSQYKVEIEIGRTSNVNKNPVAENAVRECEKEISKYKPHINKVTEEDLVVISKTINDRVRDRGYAAKEIFLRRDVLTHEPNEIQDRELSDLQFQRRTEANTRQQERRKASKDDIIYHTGDVVYIKGQISKHEPRQKYLITDFKEDKVILQKLESKFGSKQYELFLSEIIPINTNSEEVYQDLRDIENDVIEEEESSAEENNNREEPLPDVQEDAPVVPVTKRKRGRPRKEKSKPRESEIQGKSETRPTRRSAENARRNWQSAVNSMETEREAKEAREKRRQWLMIRPPGYFEEPEEPLAPPATAFFHLPNYNITGSDWYVPHNNFVFIDLPENPLYDWWDQVEQKPNPTQQQEPVLQPAELNVQIDQLMSEAAAVLPASPLASSDSDTFLEAREDQFPSPPGDSRARNSAREEPEEEEEFNEIDDFQVTARNPERVAQVNTSRVVNLDQLENYPDLDNIVPEAPRRQSGRATKPPDRHKDFIKH